MTLEFPASRWPAVLEERGPSEDPSILLTGMAQVGGKELRIVAIRVNPTLRSAPDYKRDVGQEAYLANGYSIALEVALEEFECIGLRLIDLLGEDRSSLIELATGRYAILIMPACDHV